MDIIYDAFMDMIKLIPFLFISFIIMELFEHKFDNKKYILKKNILSPAIGSLLGIIPQCGISSLSANLYAAKIISLGTLFAVFLSTSDEMLPLLIAEKTNINIILKLISLKFIIGLIIGIIIDLIYHNNKDVNISKICEEDSCHCKEGIIKSSIIHTIKISIFIFIANLLINLILNENLIINILTEKKFLTPILSSIIGLIPNCAPSILITKLYLENIISIGSCLAGLLSGSGVGILILFKQNKNIKENIIILIILLTLSSIIGIIFNII